MGAVTGTDLGHAKDDNYEMFPKGINSNPQAIPPVWGSCQINPTFWVVRLVQRTDLGPVCGLSHSASQGHLQVGMTDGNVRVMLRVMLLREGLYSQPSGGKN